MVRLHLPAVLLLAYLALLPAHPAVAQTRDPSPSANEIVEEYPLRSSLQPAAGEASAEPAPTATAEPAPMATAEPAGRQVAAQSSQETIQLALVAVLAILAFAAGFALVRPFRRRSWGERPPGTADPVAVTPTNGLGTPPGPRSAWTAEIEWRPGDGKACFRVVARPAQGAGTSVVAESAPLEWPPTSDAAVAALTAAAEDLERRLVAAGWRPLPPGEAWYARRFAWEPGARMPAAPGRFERRPPGPGSSDELWRSEVAGSPPDRVEHSSTQTGGSR